MWRQLQIGLLALFALFALLTAFCQLRCGMLGGKIAQGEATQEDLERMRGQAKKAAVGALLSLVGCMACGALSL